MSVTQLAYASSSAVSSGGQRTTVGLTSDERRPVHLSARIERDGFPIRLALSTLCAVYFGLPGSRRAPSAEPLMDPLVTVHPDRVIFEVFSGDWTTYGRVSIDSRSLAPQGEVIHGTSTVDFNRWLWESLSELRSTRENWLQVDSGGAVAGERIGPRAERRVELSGDRLRRLLEMQVAASVCSTRIALRPVHLLSTLGALGRGGDVFPSVLRFMLRPGEDAAVALEPSEAVIRFPGATHDADHELAVRAWGTRWLRLLAPVLAHADDVRLFLRASGWPSFYAVELPSVSIVLGLPGDEAWSHGIGWGSSELAPPVPPEFLAPVLASLVNHRALSVDEVIAQTGLEPPRAMRALARLCRAGRAFYEPESGRFRHREMFALPLDIASLEAMDPRTMAARTLVRDGDVSVHASERRLRRRRGRVAKAAREGSSSRPEWELEVTGTAGAGEKVRVLIRDGRRIASGWCSCSHYREWMMRRGPCEHMLALEMASEQHRLGRDDLQGAGRAPSDPV